MALDLIAFVASVTGGYNLGITPRWALFHKHHVPRLHRPSVRAETLTPRRCRAS